MEKKLNSFTIRTECHSKNNFQKHHILTIVYIIIICKKKLHELNNNKQIKVSQYEQNGQITNGSQIRTEHGSKEKKTGHYLSSS